MVDRVSALDDNNDHGDDAFAAPNALPEALVTPRYRGVTSPTSYDRRRVFSARRARCRTSPVRVFVHNSTRLYPRLPPLPSISPPPAPTPVIPSHFGRSMGRPEGSGRPRIAEEPPVLMSHPFELPYLKKSGFPESGFESSQLPLHHNYCFQVLSPLLLNHLRG